jgi:pSer/pThr/pTyr-binding forkhead associated (FHA) protein
MTGTPETIHGPIRMWLTVVGDDGPELTVEIVGPRFVIGRDETCDLVLDDPKVSRRHAEITQAAGPFRTLHDLDSANGTLVNGQPIATPLGFSTARTKTAEVAGGEWLHFGDTRVLLTLSDPRNTTEAPN